MSYNPEPSKGDVPPSTGKWKSFFQSRKKLLITATIMLLILMGVAIGVGVGVSARNHRMTDDTSASSSSTASNSDAPAPASPTLGDPKNGTYWQPKAGESWQIVLHNTPAKINIPETVFDIDLFDNSEDTIADILSAGHKVICYFSAGSYENWRPDASKFQSSDYGNPLKGWEGEYWLDVRRQNVRDIMKSRLDMAVAKNCSGVDPDNIDAYEPNNNAGVNVTQADIVDYLRFLAVEAHTRGLAIGLKNGGAIVDKVVDFLQWEVNESCVVYDECKMYKPFIDQNKPVFHIEYTDEGKTLEQICSAKNTDKFSTVYKPKNLDDTVQYCP